MRVVVGEDSLLTREGIVRLLGDAGYTVVGQGTDYPSVMRAVELESPDVVAARIRRAIVHHPAEQIVVAPDCGLKYLPRDVAFGKMCAMADGAAIVRAELG